MLPRTPLFMLLAAMLLAVPPFSAPRLPTTGSISEGIQNGASIESPQKPNDDKYTLRGKVVNSLTGEPIQHALVQISLNRSSSMLTGPDGEFQFDGLPAGQSTITVRKPGFFGEEELKGSDDGQRQAMMGPNGSPLLLKLIPEGVIYGKISEADGEPIEGIPIQLVVQHLVDGKKMWQERPGTTTDEEGVFRIPELLPGAYFLSAGPSRIPLTFPSNTSEPGAQGIPVVFYPNAPDFAAATPINIVPGRRFEINLTLSPHPFFYVSGSISGYPSGQSPKLQVLDPSGRPVTGNWRFDAATGSFRLVWIPAGVYTLRVDAPGVQGQSLTASVPLNVNSNITGIRVLLLPMVNIPIRMRMISSRTASEPFSERENSFPASVQLIPRNNGFSEFRYQSQMVGNRGNTFLELQNIAPGDYEVEIVPNGTFYVQSAVSGRINLQESNISVAPGGSVQPIEIVLRDDGASLSGKVSYPGRPFITSVLAISDRSPSKPEIQSADPNGDFEFAFLPPGAYKVLALDHPEQLEYSNPEVLRKYLSKAREVTLSADQAARLDLELVKVGE